MSDLCILRLGGAQHYITTMCGLRLLRRFQPVVEDLQGGEKSSADPTVIFGWLNQSLISTCNVYCLRFSQGHATFDGVLAAAVQFPPFCSLRHSVRQKGLLKVDMCTLVLVIEDLGHLLSTCHTTRRYQSRMLKHPKVSTQPLMDKKVVNSNKWNRGSPP